MPLTDVIGAITEILSWVGLGIGVPLLVFGLVYRRKIGAWTPAELAVVDRHDGRYVRWYADGTFHERPIRRAEAAHFDLGMHDGYVSVRQVDCARLEAPSPVPRAAFTLGLIFTAVGVVSLVVGFVLPLVE